VPCDTQLRRVTAARLCAPYTSLGTLYNPIQIKQQRQNRFHLQFPRDCSWWTKYLLETFDRMRILLRTNDASVPREGPDATRAGSFARGLFGCDDPEKKHNPNLTNNSKQLRKTTRIRKL
jgi:hypothetical protein